MILSGFQNQDRRNIRGVTLIELLVVFGIIGILMALLFPAISSVRQSAKATACANSLREIGMAFSSYAADNGNLFPAARWAANRPADLKPSMNPSGRNWQEEIQPYLMNGRTFAQSRSLTSTDRFVFCPTYYDEYVKSPDQQKLQASGYGMNPTLVQNVITDASGKNWSSWDVRFNRVLIAKPSSTILIGDSDDYFLIVTADLTPNPNKGNFYSGYSNKCGDPVRHSGKANYLFADGHLGVLTQEEATAAFLNQNQ